MFYAIKYTAPQLWSLFSLDSFWEQIFLVQENLCLKKKKLIQKILYIECGWGGGDPQSMQLKSSARSGIRAEELKCVEILHFSAITGKLSQFHSRAQWNFVSR